MHKIYVTKPQLPDLKEFSQRLEQIWDSGILTNNGPCLLELEKKLAEYLNVPFVTIFSNGTLALLTAMKSLGIEGEVITTPYSFVATSHTLWWNRSYPKFADIDPVTLNLEPDLVEKAITPNTKAILPVHVYGVPCDHEKLGAIAKKHNLKLIYDAAHAFGVRENGESILNYGDLSVLSFHATKVFNTIEGGAIISKDLQTKKKLEYLRNFGFEDEVTVLEPGINSKMNEVQALFGLMQLEKVDEQILARKNCDRLYKKLLSGVLGIELISENPAWELNYSYFPILVDESIYGHSRDELYFKLQEHSFFGRRYFYPLISNLDLYKHIDSSAQDNLPVANRVASQVICLPIYSELEHEHISEICGIIKGFAK